MNYNANLYLTSGIAATLEGLQKTLKRNKN